MNKDEIEQALEDCESAMTAVNCPFTKWEQEFIESVRDQYFESGGLSEKQRIILRGIWDKV